MLRKFRVNLIQEKLNQINAQNKRSTSFVTKSKHGFIVWIEDLLETPIADLRKYCIWRILAPYLVNIRKMSDEDALSIITMWLEKCNDIKRLTFNYRQRAKYDIRNARKIGYFPISRYSLRVENLDLKLILEDK